MLDNRFVEGAELSKIVYKLRREWKAAQGKEEQQKAHKRWLGAVREGMYQIMQVCFVVTSSQSALVSISVSCTACLI